MVEATIKEDERKTLESAIQKIIEEEVKKRKEKTTNEFSLTPEAQKLSNDFYDNKGDFLNP